MIRVSEPSLPPLSDYIQYLEQIWATGTLTHNGPILREFEKGVCKSLDLPCFIAVSNGTVALQMAIKALDLSGEIITTPFSWMATLNAIKSEKCVPVFCDIDPETLNIDTQKIERLITDKTAAIMPVHVFGNPCDVIEIERIAVKNNIRVIYDAAHAVGSELDGRSILSWGDISTTSLHATKLLTCGEGGGCVTNDQNLRESLLQIRFFGFDENKIFVRDGFNGKMTELQAALGLCNLRRFENILKDRKTKYQTYLDALRHTSKLQFQKLNGNGCNYSYFPVIFEDENHLLRVMNKLQDNQISSRRYFYPSLSHFCNNCDISRIKIAVDISTRILCLPLHSNINCEEINLISEIILDATNHP